MAKTYNIKEMATAFNENDVVSMADFGARFPLVSIKMAALFAKAPKEAYEFLYALPEYLTGQKLNAAFKNAYIEAVDEAANEAVDETIDKEEAEAVEIETKPAKKEEAKATTSKYASMKGKDLYELIKSNNLKKDYIEKTGDKKFAKDEMVKYLEKYWIAPPVETAIDEPAKVEEAATTSVDDNDDNLENKTPLQLYNICHKLGIKAKTKQTKEYYIELINNSKPKEEAKGPEDWDDSEDVKALEESSPKKEKASKKAIEKETKASEVVDDDDDWDI